MFNLTKQERQVILFLITVAFIGISINFLIKIYSPAKSIASLTRDIGKVDLNLADKDLLISIPGIGEKLAVRILEYRDSRTGFSSTEELKGIKGITDYKYEKLKDYLIVK